MGYITHRQGQKKPTIGEITLLGGRFVEFSYDPAARPQRIRRGVAQLKKQGVRQAVYPQKGENLGIFPIETLSLRRRLAATVTLERLSAGDSVTVYGDRLSGEVEQTVEALAQGVRYVTLCVPEGGEGLAQELRRRYGISLRLRHRLPERAEHLLAFAPCPILWERTCCQLYHGAEHPLPLLLPQGEQPQCQQEQLAAALYRQGVLSEGTLVRNAVRYLQNP